MPSFLVHRSPEIFARDREQAAAVTRRQSIKHRSPWAGFTPDIDPHNLPPNAAGLIRGLVARPDPNGSGEVLMPDYGFTPATDEAPIYSLPLGSDANTALAVTMLHQASRTNAVGERVGEFQLVPTAFTAGDGSNAGSGELWWFVPSTQLWTEVVFDTTGAGTAPSGSREWLFDVAEMASGAPSRTSYSGAIDQPVMVFTNNFDPVMVFPCGAVGAAGQHKFQLLTSEAGLSPFIARTVEAFNGRLYFGNTSENGTRHRQRIRRTETFTADPLTTSAGAGAFDIREFSRDLLRLEKLGQNMAAYFEDGVAFVIPTGQTSSPDQYRILKDRRGLLSTQALVPVGDQTHFGIFDDGWWLLDASGRWTELGVAEIDGKRVTKWKDTFFRNLDIDNRNRLCVEFDGFYIRIAYPVNGEDDIEDVWIYDIRNDRVFTDKYPVTCWGLVDQQIASQLLWSGATDTWSTILGSWGSFGARFGLQALMHGSIDGWVMTHDVDVISRWSTTELVQQMPAYTYKSFLSSLGEPRLIATARRLWMEYIHASSPQATMSAFGNSSDGSVGGVVSLQPAGKSEGDVLTAFRDFNFSAKNLGFSVTGTAPIMIRSFESDFLLRPWDDRE